MVLMSVNRLSLKKLYSQKLVGLSKSALTYFLRGWDEPKLQPNPPVLKNLLPPLSWYLRQSWKNLLRSLFPWFQKNQLTSP